MHEYMAIHFPTTQHRNTSLPFHWLAKDKAKVKKKKHPFETISFEN